MKKFELIGKVIYEKRDSRVYIETLWEGDW